MGSNVSVMNESIMDEMTYQMLSNILLHVTREFHSVKLICRNLYAIFSHVKKAYTANQNSVQLFSHVDV